MLLAEVRRRASGIAAVTLVAFGGSSLTPTFAWAQDVARGKSIVAEVAIDADGIAERVQASADPTRDIDRSDVSADSVQRKVEALPEQGTLDRSPPSDIDPGSISADRSDIASRPVVDEPTQPTDLPTGADKSGVTSQAISVPQGSGKIDGMGESFSAQLSTGVATFSVPFAIPPARGGAQASLGLSYSSASGLGVAGMGWSVGVPFIARETDRGLPKYDDRASWHPEQDRFVFNGGQELVPICTVTEALTCPCEDGGLCTDGQLDDNETMPGWSRGHQYFRPRVEGSFLRFFWSPDHKTWRVQDKSGVTMELGVPLDGSGNHDALERNPDASCLVADECEISKWHLVRQYDTYGGANPSSPSTLPTPFNVVVYKYFQQGGAAYLSDIFHTTPIAERTTIDTSKFAHHVRLSYQPRTDPTFSFRTGWRIDNQLRLVRVDVASKPFNGGADGARRMVRRYHLTYRNGQHTSLLESVQVEGRCAAPHNDPNLIVAEDQAQSEQAGVLPEATGCPRLPPMRFGYEHVEPFTVDGAPTSPGIAGYEGFDERVREIGGSPKHSLDEALTALFDIDSDALPDVLMTAAGTYGNGHGVFFNSPSGVADSFGPARTMIVQGVLGANASSIKLSNLNLAPLDIDGDATIDLLHMPKVKTYSKYRPVLVNGDWAWVGSVVETADAQNPKIDFGNDTLDTKVVDINFDGLVDVVVSTGTQFQSFFSLGRYPAGDGQFGSATWRSSTSAAIVNDPVRTCVPHSSTPVRFSDGDIQLAEMNGDGIPDIVRVRRGDFQYWPGRGNGFWGTGKRDDCLADTFSANRYIEMASGPNFSDIQGTSLRIDDVNGDGLDDLVQVRFDAVDVWLNVDGVAWTERHTIDGTPASPSYANRVRLVDVNGSGTRDILWGDGRNYKYIDLQGGNKPWLLTRVENGLGKSTDIEYTTSTAEMLAAEAHGGACDAAAKPWSSPWCAKMPIVAHVVKRVSESDNLLVAGRGPARYMTEYSYRDPVFDGRQREFRGFRKGRTKRIGDENSPTDFAESTFLLGECKDETVDNGVDDCSVSERWRDNPREALKGLSVLSERYDERGVYLSSDATTYRLRHLYTGLDGRAVRHAFPSAKRGYVYDTALGPAVAGQGIPSVINIELESTCTAFDPLNDDPLAPPVGLQAEKVGDVPIRQPLGHAEIVSSSVVDCFGNRVVAVARGCVAGSACPVDQTGITSDEIIFAYTWPTNLDTWLWRSERSYVKGSVHVESRGDTSMTYTSEGEIKDTKVALAGILPLQRSDPQSAPANASEGGEIMISSRSYTSLGALEQERGADGRCREIAQDLVYGVLPTSETIHTNGSGECDDPTPLIAEAAAYDRGLGLITTAVDMQFQASRFVYDGFGRLRQIERPRVGTSPGETLPTVNVEYFLPSPENAVKYSVIHTSNQDGATSADNSYQESYAYVDGLGRTLVTLSEAEREEFENGILGPERWIAGDLQSYDAKGMLCRKHLNFFYTGDPLAFPIGKSPDTAYGMQRYDAFSRQLQTFGVDGLVTLQASYHALSTELFDAADLEPGPHQGTPVTTRKDGHGRPISTTERIHVNGSIEERHARTKYLPTGEPVVITLVRAAGLQNVMRWMRYDTLGRMVLNVEPNTTQGFSDDPTVDPNELQGWRYVYNDAGDLVGTSDARGCGQNFFYDGAGRVIAEDYAPCEDYHADYSEPDLETNTGLDVRYVYDKVPPNLLPEFQRPPDYDPDSDFLRGRRAAVFSRGSTTWTTYDGRGRLERIDVRIARPDPGSVDFVNRYTPRWYTKDFAYDAADREVATTTGSTRSSLQGQAITSHEFHPSRDNSVVTTHYDARGKVKSVGGSYGPLVRSINRGADGLVDKTVYGDVAHTTTEFSYDSRRRLRNVQTYRGPPEIWNSPPEGYQPAPDPSETTSFQLVLQDEDFAYDSVDNPVEIRDWRNAEEWPHGAKPVTRKIKYDDLNRVTRVDYEYSTEDDAWTSPFAPDLNESTDQRRAQPSPHVSFEHRIKWQTFDYDWLGNTFKTEDDAKGFYDRSLGLITNDVAAGKPFQLKSATNNASGSPRRGSAAALYDAAGNLTRLDVLRNGPCVGGNECSQRFDYQWDEVGRLVRARRWDVTVESISNPAEALPPNAQIDADLIYIYDQSDGRVLKSTGDEGSHTAYIFDSLELRRAEFDGENYSQTRGANEGLTETEVPYLFANNVRLARIVYEREVDNEPRLDGSSRLHVFFELGDHLGSTSVVLDQASSELVERSSHQLFGAAESDYRPDRWEGFREDYRFTGKEEDVEVGLQYFGKRFLSPYLGRWVSADPLALHVPGAADLNLYAYVKGALLKATDPLGLGDEYMSNGGLTPDGIAKYYDNNNLDLELDEQQAVAAAAEVMVFEEGLKVHSRKGTGYHQLALLTGKTEFTNPVAKDQAAAGNTDLALIAELGHGSAFCHLQFPTNGPPSDEQLDIPHYLAVSELMHSLKEAESEFILTLPLVALKAPTAVETGSRTFFSIKKTDDVLDIAQGTYRFPTAPNKSHLGEGLYTWATEAEAQQYLKLLDPDGAKKLNVMKLTISEDNFARLNKLDVDALPDPDLWMGNNSKLWGGTPSHNLEHVTRGVRKDLGSEHFFSAPASGLFDVSF